VASGRDDDALTWDGDDDPTLAAAPPRSDAEDADAGQLTLPDGYTAVGRGSDRLERPAPDAHAPASETAARASDAGSSGNVALVALGVLGGIYLLFTVGWIIGGIRLDPVAVLLVSPAASVPALWLAILAPALWFVTVFLLTRRSPVWLRFALLAAGVLLLVPWPFIMLGAVGS
jgi:hypothetical protein